MLKLLLTLFVGSAAVSAGFFASGRILYSGFQPKLPFGSAIKVTPDPMNVWSWHHTASSPPDGKIPVLVDFDKNGRMDTENHCFRVMITDMQVSFVNGNNTPGSDGSWVRLEDDKGPLWDMLEPMVSGTIPVYRNTSIHLTTPLVLSVGSKLYVSLSRFGNRTLTIHLIGKVVNI